MCATGARPEPTLNTRDAMFGRRTVCRGCTRPTCYGRFSTHSGTARWGLFFGAASAERTARAHRRTASAAQKLILAARWRCWCWRRLPVDGRVRLGRFGTSPRRSAPRWRSRIHVAAATPVGAHVPDRRPHPVGSHRRTAQPGNPGGGFVMRGQADDDAVAAAVAGLAAPQQSIAGVSYLVYSVNSGDAYGDLATLLGVTSTPAWSSRHRRPYRQRMDRICRPERDPAALSTAICPGADALGSGAVRGRAANLPGCRLSA